MFICMTDQLWGKGSETSLQQPVCDRRRQTRARCRVAVCVCVSAWVTVVSQSECVIDSCHLLHELAELPAAWVAVTHVLGRCDHGTDTLPICVLCRAVDLPALLWARVQSLQKHRDIYILDQAKKLVASVCCCLSMLLPSRLFKMHEGRQDILFCQHVSTVI